MDFEVALCTLATVGFCVLTSAAEARPRPRRRSRAKSDAPLTSLTLRRPDKETTKRIALGFAWDVFLLSGVTFGLPLFLRRLPHRARALEVVKLPQQATMAAPPKGRAPFKPQLVDGGPAMPAAANDTRDLPILGRIAAGTPIEAIQQERDRMPVAESMLGAGEHFVLEIQGDSMINAGILDGDFVVIRRGDTATSGDIVVALIQGEEATLKRLRRKGASIALEAANPAYETRIFGPDQVAVQGKLVGLIRRYH